MARQQSFGRRGKAGKRPVVDRSEAPKSFHQQIEDYRDPAATRFVANAPWPAAAAVAITLTVTGGVILAGAGRSVPPVAVFPVMLLVGYLMYLQFRGLQAQMQDDDERIKRAISAKYPLVPILGMIAGLVYFMLSKHQNLNDIAAYDWSGLFGLRTDIDAEEPLAATLLDTMAAFGGAGLVVAYLWYRAAQHFRSGS